MRGRADRGSWQAGLKADFVPLGDRFGHLHSRLCCFFSWEIVDSFAATRLLALLRFRVAVDYTKAGGCEVLRAIRLADSCTTGKDSRVGWDEAGAFFVGSSSWADLVVAWKIAVLGALLKTVFGRMFAPLPRAGLLCGGRYATSG